MTRFDASPFHTKAGGIGLYHQSEDCRDARRIKPQNRCEGDLTTLHLEGCIWDGFTHGVAGGLGAWTLGGRSLLL